MTETPPQPCRRRFARRLDRAFTGALSARGIRRLRQHVEECEACRAVYDAYGAAERALAGQPFPEPAAERAFALIPSPARFRRRALAGAGALATAAAAALLWIVVADPDRPSDPEGDFAPRGAELAPDQLAPGEREPGVRLFCIDTSQDAPQVRDDVHMRRETLPTPSLSCKIEDELQIAYSTPSLAELTMQVFAESPDDAAVFYAPREAGRSSIPLTENAIDEALSWSTRLGAAHEEPGHYRVRAHFFRGEEAASPAPGNPIAELRADLLIAPTSEEAP